MNVIAAALLLVAAAPVNSPKQISANHVMTAAYVNGYHGTKLSPQTVARYLTWGTNPSRGHEAAVQAAGMKIYAYTDPNRAYSYDRSTFALQNLQNHPSAIARDCDGNPITSVNGTGFMTDVRTADAVAHFREIIKNRIAVSPGISWDAFFDDDAGDLLYTDGGRAPCGADEGHWIAASAHLEAAAGVPIIFNALSIGPQTIALADPPNVLGGMYEGCYAYHGPRGDSVVLGNQWKTTENIQLAMARKHKLFWCFAQNYGDPTSSAGIESRQYVYASFLLGYDIATSLLQESYQTPSLLPVMPETALVPLRSLTESTNVERLRGPTGTYDRRFGACYLDGRLAGGCAVVVNSSATESLAYPFGSVYRHTLQLTGGGVIEGGTAIPNGPPPPAEVSPKTGIIVFR